MTIETKYNVGDQVWYIDAEEKPTEGSIVGISTNVYSFPIDPEMNEWTHKVEVGYDIRINSNTTLFRNEGALYDTKKDCCKVLAAKYAERVLYYQNLGNAPVIG